MFGFKKFLREEQEAKQITHLTHLEDRPLQSGHKGAEHAISALQAAHDHIESGNHSSQLTTKYDGSPAIVYGHHPVTGKFFVASKSAFNKKPKINYTEADIDVNHGHAPGLAEKLKSALKHLPKVAPKKGVYQGDLMYTKDDLDDHDKGVSFHPNPSGLRYTAKGENAGKIRNSQIGLVTHLTYHGTDPTNLNAHHGVDHENFKQHKDVFQIDPRVDASKVTLSNKDKKEFKQHLDAAQQIHDKDGNAMYDATQRHAGAGGHLETYFNQTVRTGATPDHKGLSKYIEQKYNNDIEKLKTDKNKNKKKQELQDNLYHIDAHSEHYNNLFKLHHHLQQAKNVLVRALNQHQEFEQHHNGTEANPEGYVFHHNGESDKLIHRHEFSRRNLLGRPR